MTSPRPNAPTFVPRTEHAAAAMLASIGYEASLAAALERERAEAERNLAKLVESGQAGPNRWNLEHELRQDLSLATRRAGRANAAAATVEAIRDRYPGLRDVWDVAGAKDGTVRR